MQAVDGDSAARMQKGDPRILKDCPCDLLQKKYFTHRPSIVVFCLMLARRPAPRRSHQPWSSETLCSVPHHTTAFRSVAESLLWTGSVSWTGLKTARRSEPLPLVRVGVARLIVRLFGIFFTFCGSLALLVRFLTAALLLTRPLTRRLIVLAGLILVRHVVSFHGNTIATA